MSEEAKKPRFTLESAAELLAKPEPEIEWLIKNVWVHKSRGLIAGNPGVGKTWFALDMLMSVASGQNFLNQYPVKQAPVLLVEEEGSILNLSRRIHAMARARGLKDSDLQNFYHLTRQFVRIPTDMIELFHLILDKEIRLVVFDSLRRFHAGNENSSEEMQIVLDSFGRLNVMAETSVVLIHHLAKQSEMTPKPIFERLRGSSDLWAWRDCLIGVEGEEEADIAEVSFQFRDAEATPPFRVQRHVNETTGAITLTALGIEESDEFMERSEKIMAYMKTQFGGVSKEQVYQHIKGKKANFYKFWRILEQKGMIERNGTGWIVVPVPY